ncbi:5'-nucleotidase domain-containing protein [Anaeramoeba flamelloides]|uniref:5'-nucleotidase domain-containing protein n=1 Tax=Anaeramoeba flamelloides TaxID=1746091 RepID=A0ABQ8Y5V5_9EUKA|nr:5'-nucleotidase domain-containing protein [Anaeramoeba flamelloides]
MFRELNQTKENFYEKFATSKYVGFDLYNTLNQFHKLAFSKLVFKSLNKYLIKNKNYPTEIETETFVPHYCVKGLFVDVPNGNLIKINSSKQVTNALHGDKVLGFSDLQRIYGKKRNIHDVTIKENETPRSIRTAREIGIGSCFNRLIHLKEKKSVRLGTPAQIFEDLREASNYNFIELGEDSYFPEFSSNLDQYLQNNSKSLKMLFSYLNKSDKKVFLLTNSPPNVSEKTLTHLLGQDWKQYFDLILTNAQKPYFYCKETKTSFYHPFEEKKVNLGDNQRFKYGNAYELMDFLQVDSCEKVVFFGDNPIGDIRQSKINCNWSTVAVVSELAPEKTEMGDGYALFGKDRKRLWGKYLYCGDKLSYWGKMIQNYSDFQVPSIECFTEELFSRLRFY